jgi:hypothetical protein
MTVDDEVRDRWMIGTESVGMEVWQWMMKLEIDG